MNLLNVVSELFKPATELVDNLHTSEEEKLLVKNTMLKVQTTFLVQALNFEQERLKAKSEIIRAEASNGNWLAASWRPVTMYAFLAMLLTWWWGWTELPETVTPEVLGKVFDLLQIGIGGYIGSRGIEKIAPSIVKAFKTKEDT